LNVDECGAKMRPTTNTSGGDLRHATETKGPVATKREKGNKEKGGCKD